MSELRRILSRDWPLLMISLVLLIGGLVALAWPTALDSYDQYGIRVKCGNGYQSQLLQAEVGDQTGAREPAGGPSATPAPATDYVGQCRSAVAQRRWLAIPVAAAGFVMLIPGLAKWARAARPGSGDLPDAWNATVPDEVMHEAHLLDRRERSHWDRPHDTTL
ncbi:MAG: hypothetical protein ABI307_03430 [Mycobacterium sp.]